jgi:hypothetical protein
MEVVMRNTLTNIALTALTAATPTAIVWSESDEKMILVVNAGAATTLTVKAGNGIQGVEDLVLSVPKGISLLKLESGRFKNVSGESKGKIVVVSDGTPSVGTVAIV